MYHKYNFTSNKYIWRHTSFRKSPILITLLALFLFQPSCMFNKNESLDLRSEIVKKLTIPGAGFGVVFKDLQSGETILINEKKIFHAASTMKTPVLAELFRQSEDGNFSMEDSILVKNTFKSIVDNSEYSLSPDDDSEQGLYTLIGKKQTISSLAYSMIIESSNLATNILIEFVGAGNVAQLMKSIGANDIKVLRGVEDGKAYKMGLNNVTTAFDLSIIYEKMATGQLVNEPASEAMTRILLDQKLNDIIPALLPPEVKVAHKTGNITGIQHDSGFIILPDGRKYVLVLLSEFKKEDEKIVIRAMAEVSGMLYEKMFRKNSR